MKRIVRLTESDLTRIVRRVMNESMLLTEGVPNTTLKSDTPITIASRTVCAGFDFIKGSVVIANTGPEDAYINMQPYIKTAGVKGFETTAEYNVTIGGKPVVGQADGQNQPKIPKMKKATLNFVIKTNGGLALTEFNREIGQLNTENLRSSEKEKRRAEITQRFRDKQTAFANMKSATLMVRYNGSPLEVPVNFGGFMIDRNRACDAEIMLPKGF